MKSSHKTTCKKLSGIVLAIALLLFLGGCAEMNLGGPTTSDTTAADTSTPPDDTAVSKNQPYYPTDFNDLLIPGELSWSREKSMSIRTASFAGGILYFSGHVEINSLTNFFVASMTKDGWKMAGSVKQKRNLLVFTKKYKTTMITISEGDFNIKTEVYVYITEDIAAELEQNATNVESIN